MRFDVFALVCLGVGALALATADPPPATQPERAVTPAAVATDSVAPAASAAPQVPPPAASSPAASRSATPKPTEATLSPQEQRLINQGYKPQMRNGEKIYCRRETELGSRIGAAQHCGTVAQLTTATQDGRDYAEKVQRTQLNPTGR